MNFSTKKLSSGIKNIFPSKKDSLETPLKKEKFFYRNRFVFLAFAIPFLLMFYSFVNAKLYPFGDNQIMVIDMWHQYFEFFKILHEKLQSMGSMLYTWEGGLGTNFIALISYYAASPLYLLSIFCPTEYLTECMALIVILKISLSGAFMCIYLKNMFGKNGFGTATFAILYSLSAFAMGYYWCLMWLDVMALLPLCMLGLNKLIDEGKVRLYTVTLALMMIANYYIGVMMCIFIALYYPILYFSRNKKFVAKDFIITTVKAVLFSAIGVCMAAFILIPTYLSMQNTYYIKPTFPATNTFYNPILDVISNLLPNVALTVRGGLPNIYCGLISAMMAVLFLLCKSIPARQKVLNCIMLAFLILSFNWNKLDYIWHGLHFPNELPYRYSFVFSFILVSMAYQAFIKLKDITPAQIGAVAAGGFLYLILAEKLYSEKFDYKVIYFSLALMAAYSIVLAIYKTGRYKESLAGILLFIVAFGEMTNYTLSSVSAVGSSNRTAFYGSYNDIQTLIEKIEEQDDGFYRMELAKNWTTNDPALYGYRGISQFSSEINCNVTKLMQDIGLAADPGSNRFGYLMSTPIVNSMLNVKYIIGKNQNVYDFALGSAKYTCNGSTAYENKYPLSIGYMANSDVRDWNSEYSNPFESQNQYVWYATGVSTPVLNQIKTAAVTGSNATFGSYSNGTVSCTSSNTDATATAQLVFTSPEEQPIYAFVASQGAATITAHTENGSTVNFEANRGSVLSLGSCAKNEKIYVDITYEAGKSGAITAYVYGLDRQVWDRAYSKLSSQMLNVTSYSDTKIKGTVTAEEDGVMMTSIPYEKGWSAKVDGKKVDITPIKDALVSIDVAAGTHEIEFSYCPYGFVLGVTISVASVAALIALYYVLKKYDERLRIMTAAASPLGGSDEIDSDELDLYEQSLLDGYEDEIKQQLEAESDSEALTGDNAAAPPDDPVPKTDDSTDDGDKNDIIV